MGLYQVQLLLIVSLIIRAAHSDGISMGSKRIKMTAANAPFPNSHQVEWQNTRSNRLLRGHDEERQIGVATAVGMFGSAVKQKGKMKLYLSLGLKPELAMKLLKVTKREDKNFIRYSKYFYRYYIKYLDAPLSHLPASTVDDIMKARLYSWLDETLTPPQVLAKLARGPNSDKYYNLYRDMYADLQVRTSQAHRWSKGMG
ncbi:hypothetical protein PR001_g26518 [Phytophthora rubi]|uniref:RxLR effector protein n=1 Tax=Phytophthora rubi TaxID=129364 RepID=A0A6A3HWV9_9STRA|nr:hypothetical protein PR001_g26518 [Phytophthora rubi]